MSRYFNITGPCRPDRHYMLPPERRLPDSAPFVEQWLYFVLHAPRQTGKTTAMRALAERLRRSGIVALWATLEQSQGIEDLDAAEPLWIEAIQREAHHELPPEQRPPSVEASPGGVLAAFLTAWCAKIGDRPLVLLLDEADVVTGPALISLLRQLRAGFTTRGPGRFPTSIGLIGMRDLRDWLTRSKEGVPANPGSPFNIKIASLTLRNFSEAEVGELYAQHTADTGQIFTTEAINRVFWWSQGHPFLVNALARIVVTELCVSPTIVVEPHHIDAAKEKLVLSRTTHLDALAERLKEPRVARIVQAVLLGDQSIAYDHDDFTYVSDLGLVRLGRDGAEAANPLYREVLGRQLTLNIQVNLPRPRWRWAKPDGRLDLPALMDAFFDWWRDNSEIVAENTAEGYREAVAHLAFMGYLQRVVNGGGEVLREFAAGRGAVDLVVKFADERHIIEIKRVPPTRRTLDRVRDEGVLQLADYLDTLGATEGWLLVFDQRPGRTWEERLWSEDREIDGKKVRLRGG